MPSRITSVNRKKNREAGFSFIELMISIVVFAIFTGAIYGLLRVANIQKSTVSAETEVMSNLRLSLNTIGRDAVNTGLRYDRIGGNMPDNLTNLRMGLPADANATQDLLTAVISGNNINANNFLPNTQKTDVISFAYRDVDFNGGNPIKITNSSALGTGGVVLTTTADAAFNANQNATPFDLYLISNGTRTAMGLATNRPDNSTLEFSTNAAADILGINSPYNGTVNTKSKLVNCVDQMVGATDCMNYGAGQSVSAIKIFWISYHVTPEGTLIRTTYGNNTDATAAQQIQTQPLAYNISNLQIRYLLRDGTSSDDPSANGTNQNALNNVVQIEVTMSANIDVKENGVSLQRVVDLKSTFSTKNLNY